MCRLAFLNDSRFEVSSLELERGSKSYTVDTIRKIKKDHPDDEIFFIMGSDMLKTFTRWYLWEDILESAFVCAASREKGFSADLSEFDEKQKKKIIILDIEPLEISSTQIRGAVAGNGEKSNLIDKKVLAYIKEKKLYDDGLSAYRTLLCEKLDEHRLFHSECVSECAAVLAEKYNADVEKARLAGLLHDVMKNASPDEQMKEMMEAGMTFSKVELANKKVWHQFSGAAFLKNRGIVSNKEILAAVRWHTTGRAGMSKLEKIVYTADFISADRKYKDVDVVRKLADLSLEHAILYTSRYTLNKLASGDMVIHPATADCYNDMLLHFEAEKG